MQAILGRLVLYLVAICAGAVLSLLTYLGIVVDAEAVEGLEKFLTAVIGGGLGLVAMWIWSKLPFGKKPPADT
jgi:hypothetical protein